MKRLRTGIPGGALVLICLLCGPARADAGPPELLFQLPWSSSPLQLDGGGDERPARGPGALALGPGGEILVLDGLAERIQVLDEAGRLLRSIPIQGWADNLAVAKDGRLALWRRHLRLISVLDAKGNALTTMPLSVHFGNPRSLAFTESGEIEVENAFGERFPLGTPDAPRSLRAARLDRRHGPAGSRIQCAIRLEGQDRIHMALWADPDGLGSGRESAGRKWIDLPTGLRLRSARLASPCGRTQLLLELETRRGEQATGRQILRVEGDAVLDRFQVPEPWLYVPYSRFSCRDGRCVFLHPIAQGLQVWSWRMP